MRARWRSLLLNLQHRAWHQRHGRRCVVAGAAAGEVGDIEHAVGRENVIAAGGAEVPEGLEFFRVEVDVGGVALVAGGDEVRAGAHGRAAAADPFHLVAELGAAGEIVEDVII